MGEAKNYNQGPDVDDIYASIKNSAPIYEWEESIVTFQNEGMTLVCSLTIPITSKKPPIIITLNGFGGDRNDVVIVGTDEPLFKRFARILAENGLASLRVDFRGSGDSDGEYQMTTFSTQISDTLAAVNYICGNLRHQVNIKSIGIMGFSQGGLVGSTAAAKDRRVDSLVLWSPVASALHCYQGLLTREGIQQGLALPDGGYDMFGLYVNGQYVGLDMPLGKGFFEDLFRIDPLAEIRRFDGSMMVIVGQNDPIVWPQPAKGQLYMKYHRGYEKSVVLDADHAFNWWEGPEKLDTAFYWSTAWFIKTLKHKKDN
ncbi:MAG: alpha/beta fold hydrolase [Candidatus Aminicenantes bacterium]|nr:alpha/beta fold hydrolase [Candidatus Aminicenantes bacterium]NIM83329.1 alpha/beta fold hydrolase [Candidatus Aminicenantes bacterium]NIN22688.1 alpha/beta fold hydrolase [Candidatus Aminicenantes bacterium]NIN46448.1 alpha/beta fold hydrolase [Candidatus Aminicenantes bacterium]NIN89300.1 alpha/beta fold hydrolase [Candidatus Aminicenantes bacterium]